MTAKKTKKFRKIRRRRSKGASSKMYFGPEVQDAIITTQNEEDEKKKEKIFVDTIRPAFDKLAENLILIYGFATPNEPFEHLKIRHLVISNYYHHLYLHTCICKNKCYLTCND